MARPAERPGPDPPVEGQAAQASFDEGALATDAPEPWPRTGPLPPQGSQREARRWARALADHLDQVPALEVRRLGPAYLFAEGVVEATAELADRQGHRWAVFAYDEADPRAAAAFARVQALFERRTLPTPVYYAPEDLEATDEEGDPFTGFGPHLLAPWPSHREPVEGTYAVWWATDRVPDLGRWSGAEAVGRALTALEGAEAQALDRILAALGEAEDHDGPGELPEEPHQLLVEGPEGRPVLLTFSQGRGLRFHLHIEQTPPAYRDAFWTLVADHYERQRATGELGEIRSGQASDATDWWWQMTQLGQADLEVLVVGGVIVGQPSDPWSGSQGSPAVA